MFIEVEVQESANCSFALNRVYSALADPVPITWVSAPGPLGDMGFCEIIGWSIEGPCQAYGALVEDSGEGQALLVYGGDQGVRLRPWGSLAPWSTENSEQWGEPCMLLDLDVQRG